MTAGGCVCHRAELGHWLIPGLNLRRPHMTSLWEYVCQGWERRLEGGGSDFRIQAGNIKYIYESQANIHHMSPLTLPVQKSGFGHKKLYLTSCSVPRGTLGMEEKVGEPAMRPASVSQSVSKTRAQGIPWWCSG